MSRLSFLLSVYVDPATTRSSRHLHPRLPTNCLSRTVVFLWHNNPHLLCQQTNNTATHCKLRNFVQCRDSTCWFLGAGLGLAFCSSLCIKGSPPSGKRGCCNCRACRSLHAAARAITGSLAQRQTKGQQQHIVFGEHQSSRALSLSRTHTAMCLCAGPIASPDFLRRRHRRRHWLLPRPLPFQFQPPSCEPSFPSTWSHPVPWQASATTTMQHHHHQHDHHHHTPRQTNGLRTRRDTVAWMHTRSCTVGSSLLSSSHSLMAEATVKTYAMPAFSVACCHVGAQHV